MFKHITIHSIANEIYSNVKNSVPITKDKILLEVFMAMRYKSCFEFKGLHLGYKDNHIVVKGVFNSRYKIGRMMNVLGFDPGLNSINNYMGFEKYDLFIDEDKRPHKSLEEYIAGSKIDLEDLKDTLSDLKNSSVSSLASGHMLKLSLDDYIGITLYPSLPGITSPYYFTFKEFILLIK